VLWLSKDVGGADAPGFSDEDGFFMDFDATDGGDLVGGASDGTTLFAVKRSRVYLVQGEGPDLAGTASTHYPFPSPLPVEAGFSGPRVFAGSPDGLILQTA